MTATLTEEDQVTFDVPTYDLPEISMAFLRSAIQRCRNLAAS